MASSLRDLVADLAPGPPLIENNAVFYAVFAALLVAVLLLILRFRRAGRKR